MPGWRPLEQYLQAAAAAADEPLPAPARLSACEAMARRRSLTRPELELLTVEGAPPPGAVELATANGPLWLHPDEARSHPALRSGSLP
ncbi:hypothetical protein ACFVYE_18910 [Streptomyces sp. NPDC058239]|uniref:hypothetical protein n=1 Tax=unclassified Streptomyces TaxID=2593676 RepID=UPI00365FACDB